MLKKSPYEILGLNGSFTYKEIKKAYRHALRAYPPEQYPEAFMAISDAYETLTREEYFINNLKNNLFYFDIEADAVEPEPEDLTPYLKKIFEVPFDE